MSLGAEEVQARARLAAIKKQRDEAKRNRAEGLLAFYKEHGVDAR